MTNNIRRKTCLLIMILLMLMILCGCAKIETFSEATGKRDRQVSYIASNDGVLSKREEKKLLDRYKNAKFRRWTGSLGSTTHTVYRFYDGTGQILFEAEELGNRSLVKITAEGKNSVTYQMTSEKHRT